MQAGSNNYMYKDVEENERNKVIEVELYVSDIHSFASHIWNVVSKYRQMKKLKIV